MRCDAGHRRHNWERSNIQRDNANLHSLRCDMRLKLEVAQMFRDDTMYFPHNLDFRGRAYPIPPHLNHMGADLNRFGGGVACRPMAVLRRWWWRCCSQGFAHIRARQAAGRAWLLVAEGARQ